MSLILISDKPLPSASQHTQSSFSSSMLTLSLNPSHSFSIDSTSSTLSIPPTSPFTLGLSLSHVLSILALPTVRALFPKYANADIKFDERDPISSPIVLSLPLNIQENNVSGARLKGNDQEQDESGLHLIFDGKSQRVQMIVLTGLQQSNVEIMYSPRGNLIHKGGKGSQTQGTDSGGLTRAGLHQFLGPTYPGVARAKTFGSRSASTSMLPGEGGKGEEVITSYPGVAFGFDVRSRKREGEKERTDVGECSWYQKELRKERSYLRREVRRYETVLSVEGVIAQRHVKEGSSMLRSLALIFLLRLVEISSLADNVPVEIKKAESLCKFDACATVFTALASLVCRLIKALSELCSYQRSYANLVFGLFLSLSLLLLRQLSPSFINLSFPWLNSTISSTSSLPKSIDSRI